MDGDNGYGMIIKWFFAAHEILLSILMTKGS